MKGAKGDIYILAAIICFMVLALVLSSGYPYLQSKLAPMLVGLVILALAAVELLRTVFAGKAQAYSKDSASRVEKTAYTRAYLAEACWMVGFCLLIYLAGFIGGIAGFATAYAKSHKAGWPVSILLGSGVTLLSYFLFSYLVGAELYPGLLFQILGSGP